MLLIVLNAGILSALFVVFLMRMCCGVFYSCVGGFSGCLFVCWRLVCVVLCIAVLGGLVLVVRC